jgi:hypothetical protein
MPSVARWEFFVNRWVKLYDFVAGTTQALKDVAPLISKEEVGAGPASSMSNAPLVLDQYSQVITTLIAHVLAQAARMHVLVKKAARAKEVLMQVRNLHLMRFPSVRPPLPSTSRAAPFSKRCHHTPSPHCCLCPCSWRTWRCSRPSCGPSTPLCSVSCLQHNSRYAATRGP